MAGSLLDRLGLGNERAVANARRALLDRQRDERIIAELVACIRAQDARRAPRGGVGAEAA